MSTPTPIPFRVAPGLPGRELPGPHGRVAPRPRDVPGTTRAVEAIDRFLEQASVRPIVRTVFRAVYGTSGTYVHTPIAVVAQQHRLKPVEVGKLVNETFTLLKRNFGPWCDSTWLKPAIALLGKPNGAPPAPPPSAASVSAPAAPPGPDRFREIADAVRARCAAMMHGPIVLRYLGLDGTEPARSMAEVVAARKVPTASGHEAVSYVLRGLRPRFGDHVTARWIRSLTAVSSPRVPPDTGVPPENANEPATAAVDPDPGLANAFAALTVLQQRYGGEATLPSIQHQLAPDANGVPAGADTVAALTDLLRLTVGLLPPELRSALTRILALSEPERAALRSILDRTAP